MKIIITERQYRLISLISESKELMSSFDNTISDLSKIIHIPYGNNPLGQKKSPWFIFLIFDNKNKKELLKKIRDWKINNDVTIFLSDENSLKNNNHRHGLSMYRRMKDYVGFDEISSEFNNPNSMGIFITPKKELIDTEDKVFYHTSFLPDLDKIGLKTSVPNMKYKNRLYFWDNIDIARRYGMNNASSVGKGNKYYIYQVDLNGYNVARDFEEGKNAYYINLPVSPDRVKFFEKGTINNWEWDITQIS